MDTFLSAVRKPHNRPLWNDNAESDKCESEMQARAGELYSVLTSLVNRELWGEFSNLNYKNINYWQRPRRGI